MSKSLRNSLKWSFLGQVFIVPLGMIMNIILVRLVGPEAYGLLAMVGPISAVLITINSFGIASSLVSKKELSAMELSSIFWFRLATSMVISGFMSLSAPLIVQFFNEPELLYIVYYFAIILLFSNAYLLAYGLLQRDLRFREIAVLEFLATLGSGILAIGMALNGYSYESLIAKQFIYHFALCVAAFSIIKWKPSLHFNWSDLKYHLKFGSYLTADGLLSFFSRNLDDIIIGKSFGATTLGIYTKGYSLLVFPLNNISKIVTKALLPEFSKIQEDLAAVKTLYLKTAQIVFAITCPIGVFLFITSDQLVAFLFGPAWESMIPYLKIFSLLSIFQSIGPLGDLVYQGLNKTNRLFKYGLVINIITIFSIIAGYLVTRSALGIAISYAIFNVFSFFLSQHYIGKEINFGLMILLKKLYPYIQSLFLTGVLLSLLNTFLINQMPHLVFLIINGLFLIFAYLILLKIFFNKETMELKTTVAAILKKPA